MNTSFTPLIGGWAILFLVLLFLIGVAIVTVGLVIWLTQRKRQTAGTDARIPPRIGSAGASAGWCPRCETPLPPGSPQGLCPRCVMGVGLSTETETGPHGTKIVPPPESEVARRFPHLEILGCLGHGGMGVVYKARQPKLNRTVALKILTPEKGADPRFAERFQREAQALARLSHPNIIAVHDYGEADGMFYVLTEYVDGMTLRQLLRQGHLQPKETLAIVPPICEALQFAHEQGVVHRDIKPENILIDKQGRVKIADFGIAKLVGPSGSESQVSLTQDQVIGTPHYMAPEQVEHPETVDHRADIYSLGVVFYELLTGELPLGKFQPPSRKVQVDVRLDEVVLRALEKEPGRRYQKAKEVKTDVETISRPGSAGSAGTEQSGTGLRAFLKTPPGKLSLAGALLVILIGVGVWLAAPKHPHYVLSGFVLDANTQGGLSAAVVTISRSGEGRVLLQTRTDTNGHYQVVWPEDTDLLYWRDGIRHSVDLVVAVKAPGFEEQSVTISETHRADYYRRTQSFRLKRSDSEVGTSPEPARTSVRLHVGDEGLQFRGHPTTWEGLPELLENVPNRARTVLELAVSSDEMTVATRNELMNRVVWLAQQHGFDHASFVGVHPPEPPVSAVR